MEQRSSTPLSGRRAQAARNDRRILESARAVFLADPAAPIAAVAEHAGVGIGALYRRYASKEELLRHLASEGMDAYLERTDEALADEGDPWEAFARFMRRSVDEGASSMTLRLAGTFTPTQEMDAQGRKLNQATQRLLQRTKAAGVLRDDVEVGDLSLIFEQLQAVRVADDGRTRVLRQRYLALLLEALRAPAGVALPGPAPTWAEIQARYDP